MASEDCGGKLRLVPNMKEIEPADRHGRGRHESHGNLQEKVNMEVGGSKGEVDEEARGR